MRRQLHSAEADLSLASLRLTDIVRSYCDSERVGNLSEDPKYLELTKKIASIEGTVARLERDLTLNNQDLEAYLRELFGNYQPVPRDDHTGTDIYFGGYGQQKGDGLGHGHAFLSNSGRLSIFREPMAPGYEFNDGISNYRYSRQQRKKHRGKKARRNKKTTT